MLIRQNITSILTNQKEYQKAIPYYEEILALDSSQYVNRYQYGVCLALTNQTDQAKETFNHALERAKVAEDQEMIAKIKEMLGHLEGN